MSCQDVCVAMEYDGSNEFYREAVRRAAKPHWCCECGHAIAAGDRYHYASGKSDGDFFDAHTCLACAEVRQTFACGGWVFGELWESINDQVFSEWDDMKAIDCLARLKSDAAIEKMRSMHARYRSDE